MVTFRKVKDWLFRKIVIEHDAKEFAKEFSFAQSELLLFIKDDVSLCNLTTKIYREIHSRLFEIIPSADPIAVYHVSETSKNVMCIRCFATRSDGYLVYGARVWLRTKGTWRYYNFGNNKWIPVEIFPDKKFKISCCGCCGDVNTFNHFDVEKDYYFVY